MVPIARGCCPCPARFQPVPLHGNTPVNPDVEQLKGPGLQCRWFRGCDKGMILVGGHHHLIEGKGRQVSQQCRH